jgi:WD repeat-containing protein 19
MNSSHPHHFSSCKNYAQGRIALAGSNSIRIMDVSGTEYGEVKSDAIDLDPSLQIEKVGWTKDGQVLTVGTTNGQILSYLAALPVVSDFYGTQVQISINCSSLHAQYSNDGICI